MKTLLSFLVFIGLTLSSNSQVCAGDFVFDTQAEVDQFAIDNPTCDSIVGSVTIGMNNLGDPVQQLNALQNITTIIGPLTIIGDFDLTGLNNLTSVGELYLNAFIGDLSPLENLQDIGTLEIDATWQNDFHVFDNIISLNNLIIGFGGYPEWSEAADLYDIFPSLTTVNNSLFIGGYSDATCDTLTGFDALTHVETLYIGYDPLYMNHFDAMHNLQTLGTFYNFAWSVHSISGFENLQSVDYVEMSIDCDCDLPDFESLQDVDDMNLFNYAFSQPDFPSLTQVNGDVLVMGNANSLGFVNLETVQGNLEILPDLSETYSYFSEIHLDSLREVYGNFGLANTGVDNIDFLSNLDSVGGTITLVYNLNLSDCEIDYLCQQIPIEPEMFVIENNVGCASPQEVLASCGNSYVAGQVFYDLDCDGIFNNDDLGVANPIIGNELNTPVSGSNSLGEYFVPLADNSTSTFTVLGMPLFSSTSHTITTGNSTEAFDNFDFPLCPTVNLHDVGVSAYVISSFRPGFNTYMYIQVHNYSMYPDDVELVLNLDNMPGVSATYIDNSGIVSGNSVIWTLEDMAPFSTGWVTVILHLDSSIPPGQVLTSSLSATLQPTTLEDINLSNNTNSYSYTVVSSFDPNDISVNIQSLNYEEFPAEGLTLDYLIRFQNTGTAPAEFVRVTDIIEEDLNLGTIEILGASHPFQLTFNENREVEWLFENIQLPDSTTDLEGSQGYIHYRIKTIPDIAIDDVIENTAAIYFDYNEPVITNTATTIFYECPEELAITTEGNYCEGESIVLLATYGWDEYSWTVNDQPDGTGLGISLDNAEPGIYFITCEGTTTYCTGTAGFEFFVEETPDEVVITGDQEICEGENFELTASSGWDSYSWLQNGDVISNTNILEIIAPANGASTIELITSTANCESTTELSLYVGANPAVTIEFNLETQLITGPTWYMYDWYINGQLIEEENLYTINPWLYGVDGFEAYAIVTGPNGCTTTTNTVSYVGIPEGVENFIEVYPNPMTESTIVKLPAGNFEIELYNAIGQQLNAWSNVQNNHVVHRNQLTSGAYMLKMTNETGVVFTTTLFVR